MESIEKIRDTSNTKGKEVDYARRLEFFDLKPQLRGPWAIVGKTDRIQGWKLHISTIPGEVISLLNCVVPCLLRHEVTSFKIARDALTLGYLNEGELGRTQVGKFMTIYPKDDETLLSLTLELAQLTKGMHGPRIISDMRLGDVLYTRYGGFNPIVQRDRLGLIRLMIYAPDKTLRLDDYQVPFQHPEGVESPFKEWKLQLTQNTLADPIHKVDGKSTKLFGPGYLILDVIRDQPKGGVFKVLDLRCQESIGIKALKQGRQFCMTDEFDRDMRSRLQRQEMLHKILGQHITIPASDEYFEVEGDGYLPIEWIEGKSIEAFSVTMLEGSCFGLLSLDKKIILFQWYQKLLKVVSQLHAIGYVHRDLTASNVWLGDNEKLYLLDLELCHALDDPTPALGLGTAGFMSPQQANREVPTVADDIYALGCLLILILTGIDPRRIPQNNEADLLYCLLEITQEIPISLLNIIVQCVSHDPANRPSLEIISNTVEQSILELKQNEKAKIKNQNKTYLHREQISYVLSHGIRGLLTQPTIQNDNGIWLSTSTEGGAQHQAKNRYVQQFELRQSANRGISGIVYALSRFARYGFLPQEGIAKVQEAINWLLSSQNTIDANLPGLHFGTAGVSVALVEAINNGLQATSEELLNKIQSGLHKPIDWPDITHGAAGQGIAGFYCFDRLGISSMQEHVEQCAVYLIENQNKEGSWVMPQGVPGMSGEILSGFAHGVAGIVYFLAEYAYRKNDSNIWDVVTRSTNWLQKEGMMHQQGRQKVITWPYSNQNFSRWHWWCHGGPGISLTFIRLYELTGEIRYANLARKALNIHPVNLRYPNLSQCHGLSGLGEIYLEAYRVLGDEEWFDRAQVLAKFIYALKRTTPSGELYWLAEDPHVATADLMVGNSGILHFYLRLLYEGKQFGMPLMLDSI